MIPNALANTGPYAGLWGHLKSIEHALVRTLDGAMTGSITELDKDRLLALRALLQDILYMSRDTGLSVNDDLISPEASHSDYSLAFDFRAKIESNHEFDQWQKPSRKSFVDDLERLIKALDSFVSSTPRTLFKNVPREEFRVLSSIVQSLVSDAELALQT